MEKIIYDIKRVEQADRFDCVQASGVSFLSHYGVQKTLQEIKKEVPVFINSKGKELGTAIGHIAKYFLQQGFDVTLHTSDIEIFDQSWQNLSSEKLSSKILERQSHLKHALYEYDALSVICDGFVQFLKEGGNIVFPVVDEVYIYMNFLNRGQFMQL